MSDVDETASGRGRIIRILKAAASIGIVLGIFVGVFPAIADYGEVWSTLSSMSGLEIASLVVVAVWNITTYWYLMVAVLPGLTLSQAAVVNQASTAVSNTLPGGGALGVGVSFAMYSSWGFGLGPVSLATVVSGVWNTFVKLGLPIVAVALLALAGGASMPLIVAALLGVVALAATILVFWLMLRSESVARRVGAAAGRFVTRLRRLFRKAPVAGWDEAAADFFSKTGALVTSRWLRITVAALVSHLSLFVVLLLSLRHVGISESEVGWLRVLAAFAFVRLISALPITPGGVGVVELGYTAALAVGLDDTMTAGVVAAVLLFRFITYALPIPFGAGAYVFWRRNTSWRVQEAAS